jgi:hypothetical protein
VIQTGDSRVFQEAAAALEGLLAGDGDGGEALVASDAAGLVAEAPSEVAGFAASPPDAAAVESGAVPDAATEGAVEEWPWRLSLR